MLRIRVTAIVRILRRRGLEKTWGLKRVERFEMFERFERFEGFERFERFERFEKKTHLGSNCKWNLVFKRRGMCTHRSANRRKICNRRDTMTKQRRLRNKFFRMTRASKKGRIRGDFEIAPTRGNARRKCVKICARCTAPLHRARRCGRSNHNILRSIFWRRIFRHASPPRADPRG